MKKLVLLVLSLAFLLTNASAQLLFQDSFNYTASSLLAPENDTTGTPNPGLSNGTYNWRYAGAGGANNNAPGIASAGLSYDDVSGYSGLPFASGNSVLFDATQIGSARIQVTPSAISSGTVYWSALLKVNDVTSLNNVNGAMLGGFNNTVGPGTLPTAVGAVLRIRQDPTTASQYDIGTAVGTATGTAIAWSGPQNTGATLFITASYQFVSGTANDVVNLWINPNQSDFGDATAPTATLTKTGGGTDPFTSLSTFNLRNVNTVGTSWSAQLDELKVGNNWTDVMPSAVPEPACSGMVGLALLLFAAHRRLRQ